MHNFRQIIILVSSEPSNVQNGIFYALALFLCVELRSLAVKWYFVQSFGLSLKVQTVLLATLYRLVNTFIKHEFLFIFNCNLANGCSRLPDLGPNQRHLVGRGNDSMLFCQHPQFLVVPSADIDDTFDVDLFARHVRYTWCIGYGDVCAIGDVRQSFHEEVAGMS